MADLDGRVIGLFDDALPTSEQLRAMCAAPSSGYDADGLRGLEDDLVDPPDDDAEAGPTRPVLDLPVRRLTTRDRRHMVERLSELRRTAT